MTSGRGLREHAIGEAITNIVSERPGILEQALVEHIANEVGASEQEVRYMVAWFVEEHQVVRRIGRGGHRIWPYESGFAIKRHFPPGSPRQP